MHSIKLKFNMYHIKGHSRTNPIEFSECRMHSIFKEHKKEFLYIILWLMESNSLTRPSIQMVHSIKFKIGMYILGHRPTYCISFGKFRINNIFTGVEKRILIHYSLWS